MADGVAAETELEFAELLQTLQAPLDGPSIDRPKEDPLAFFEKHIGPYKDVVSCEQCIDRR